VHEFYSQWRDEAVTPLHPPTPLRVAPAGAPPAGLLAPLGAAVPSCVRAYVNDACNSRLALAGPYRAPTPRFSVGLPRELHPTSILTHGDRAVICGPTQWALIDLDAPALIAQGATIGEVTLDLARGCFCAPEALGVLSARRLSDGREAYAVPLSVGEIYRRTYTAYRGARLLCAGEEQQLDLHDGAAPSTSVLEILELGSSLATDTSGLLVGAHCTHDLLLDHPRICIASASDRIVVARTDKVYQFDFELTVERVFTGVFEPLALSLAESGAYLLASFEGATYLWRIDGHGHVDLSARLAATAAPLVAPPLVAPDQSCVILHADHVTKVSPHSHVAWEYRAPGLVPGGTITSDGMLLLSCGTDVIAFRANGTSFRIHRFKGPLRTAPLLAEPNRLLVASGDTLWILEP